MRPLALASLVALASVVPAGEKTGEWAKGITYTTDWQAAIKEARNTGKILFIYNGWEREKI